jgi:ubiquinone/menaquinone biosynthesis C-methylase UbiE
MDKNKIDRQYYDETGYFKDAMEVFADLNSPFQRYRIKKVLEIYTPGKSEQVLDLGCGWGTFCFALAPLCAQIAGVDFSLESIELCRRLLAKRADKNVKFVQADVSDTKLPDGSFDLVICADLVEHLYPDVFLKTLDEAKRLLKPKGKIVIWAPNRGHFMEIMKNHDFILKKDPSHVDYKTMEQLAGGLTERNFKIIKKYYVESHIPVLRVFEKLFSGVFPFMRRRIAILAQKE